MARKEKKYRALKGQSGDLAVSWNSRYKLWLGSDHLFSVNNEGYAEYYKRFYFKDIQAVVIHETVIGKVITIVLGSITLIFLALTLAGMVKGWELAIKIMVASIAGFFGFLLLVNWLKGPTCACYLKTEVQTERLFSLSRIRKTMKAIGELSQLIESVQGNVGPLPVAMEMETLQEESPASEPPEETTKKRSRVVRAVRQYAGKTHELLFAILLLHMCHHCFRFFSASVFLFGLVVVLWAALVPVIVRAIIKQFGTNLSDSVKIITWCALGYAVVNSIFVTMHSMVMSISRPEIAGDPWRYAYEISQMSPDDSMVLKVKLIASIIAAGTLGFGGLYMLNRFEKSEEKPPQISTPGQEPATPAGDTSSEVQ